MFGAIFRNSKFLVMFLFELPLILELEEKLKNGLKYLQDIEFKENRSIIGLGSMFSDGYADTHTRTQIF